MSLQPVRVVLAGASGHGHWHLANLRRLTRAGLVELVGVCDVAPVAAGDLAGLGAPAQSADLAGLIERTGAEVTILVTPIHTHADLAVAAVHAGSHLLLEKPPAGSLADYERIGAAVRATGRVCQVGFQALGSDTIPFVRKLVADGHLGKVRGIGVAGAWERPASYYQRALWAGRRRLDGAAVTDGVLTNPFAHAVSAALAVAEAEQAGAIAEIEVELYRANPIEADDTSCVRLRLATGIDITVAVTLCAPSRHEPYLVVHGDAGTAKLCYLRDEIHIGQSRSTHARTDLLENLVDHVRTGAQLLVPLARTEAFMHVVEAVRRAPEPAPIPGKRLADPHGGRVVPGIVTLTDRSAARLALYSELGVPWAPPEQAISAGGHDVARYRWRTDLPTAVAPRPHLRSVRTFGGVEVCEVAPADHPHHLGVGVAIADVGGTNFWGGRTYLPGRGPTWRRDHGRQQHVRFARREAGGFTEYLEWLDPNGIPVLAEERVVSARPVDGTCWLLDFSSTLTNRTATPVEFRSSATKGRDGAGYGGFFWRAPGSALPRMVFTEAAGGEARINGGRAPWVAMSGTAPGGRDWTLVFAQLGVLDPWFVRVHEYPGVGTALAWERPLVLDTSLTRRVITIIADGWLGREVSAELVGRTAER